MAESLLDSFLTCSVCLQTYTDPVTLGCNHSFCSSCLNQYWSQQSIKICPVCRRRISKDHLPVNFALKELSEQFKQSLQISASTQQTTTSETEERTGDTTVERTAVSWSVCPSHPQVPPIFCLDDSRPLCALCEFSLHPQHTVVRGEEAERRLKELISSQLQALNKEKDHCEQLQKTYEDMQRHAEKQTDHCERQIRAVFSGLYRFLQEEEQRALSALREEQLRQAQNMGPELEKVREKLISVDKSIKELERQLQTHTYTIQHQSPMPRLRPKAGLMLDQAKVLGNLGFRVWRNMRREVHYRPVVLDPNTANGLLCLSEDLSSVRYGKKKQELPLNPERCTVFSLVLGSEGFSSGVHQWEVEVGDLSVWTIGVVKESIQWEKTSLFLPECGVWCFGNCCGVYRNVFHKRLIPQRCSERVRVQLDYDRGELTFSDADDMTPICCYRGSFTERLFPFFYMGKTNGQTTELRIKTMDQDVTLS